MIKTRRSCRATESDRWNKKRMHIHAVMQVSYKQYNRNKTRAKRIQLRNTHIKCSTHCTYVILDCVRLARVIFLSHLWRLAMTAAYTFLASADVFSASFRFQISSSFRCDVIKVKVCLCFEENKEKNNVNFV